MSAYGEDGDDGATEDGGGRRRGPPISSPPHRPGGHASRCSPAKAKKSKQRGSRRACPLQPRQLVSGGDALVEVVLPEDVDAGRRRVTVDGRDVTSAFAFVPTAPSDGCWTGSRRRERGRRRHDEERQGRQAARAPDDAGTNPRAARSSRASSCSRVFAQPVATPTVVTIPGTSLTQTSITGQRPRGSGGCELQRSPRGTRLVPAGGARTATCTFTNRCDRCFEPYNLDAPPAPADIAGFTNDRATRSEHRPRRARERSTAASTSWRTLYEPDEAERPVGAAEGGNGKLYWLFVASSGVSRFPDADRRDEVWNNTALETGFMVATSSLPITALTRTDTLAPRR